MFAHRHPINGIQNMQSTFSILHNPPAIFCLFGGSENVTGPHLVRVVGTLRLVGGTGSIDPPYEGTSSQDMAGGNET